MTIHRSTIAAAPVLRNPGKTSTQIVSPPSDPDALATITRVVMEPDAISSRHSHDRSEQIWIVERGEATLLLSEDEQIICAGDVIRTPPGVTHGIKNHGLEPFVYLTITVPPQDMGDFYHHREPGST